MNINRKKSIIIALDIAIAVYLLFAVTEFNKPDGKATICTQVRIDIAKSKTDGFLNEEEIKKILERNNLYPVAQPMAHVNTRAIEEILNKSPFVEKAQCYKTQNGHICISLTQHMPVLRVMANNGEDYYIDNQGERMPESKYSCDMIVATGSITPQYAKKTLARVANHLLGNPFWENQIVQINVRQDGTMEMVPRVGEHIVYLGAPQNIPNKLERLRKFYKYGLSEAGWNKYSQISVEFDNQIICKKKVTKTDNNI